MYKHCNNSCDFFDFEDDDGLGYCLKYSMEVDFGDICWSFPFLDFDIQCVE